MFHLWIGISRWLRHSTPGAIVSMPPQPLPPGEAGQPRLRIEPLEERAHPGIIFGN